MTAGLQVWGDHGFLQIDETNRGMVLVMHGDVATTANQTGGTSYTYTGVAGRPPIVAVRSTGPPVAAYALAGSGNTWTIGFHVGGSGAGRPGTISPGQAHFYVYDWPDNIPATNYGFQIYNSQGQLCFDAARPYMRIVGINGVFQWAMGSSGTLQSTIEPTGKKYAVWCNDWAIVARASAYGGGGGGMTTIDMFCGGTNISANNLFAGECWYSSSGGTGTGTVFQCNGRYMLLDVTGHDQF